MTRFNLLTITFLIFSNIIPSTVSEIKNTYIQYDSRPIILFERFGFAHKGHVFVSVKDIIWESRDQKAQLKPSSIGFFMAKDSAFSRILNESENTDGFCVLSSQYVRHVLKFENLKKDFEYKGTVDINDNNPDEYQLVFANCQPEFHVSMNVHTEIYNLIDGQKDFLPAGQTVLPKMYLLFFMIYSSFFAIWMWICIKNRSTVDKIHIIMGTLLVVKALKMACAYEDKLFVSRTGTPHGWDVAFYVFGFFKGIMLFTVITLIGTGWSFVKPYLQEREKNVLIIVIPLQVFENIAYVVISETGPATKDFVVWNQMFLIIDVFCCCAVFFPIVWSIKGLREAPKSDGKAARNLKKLTLFKQFYVVVVSYLYFTRIIVTATGAVLSYRYEWVMYISAEGASLAFYIFIFHNFQPVEKNPYLRVDEEDESIVKEIQEEDNDDHSFEL